MKKYTWKEAKKHAAVLRVGGHNDWRLPTVNELQTLWDYAEGVPIIPMVSSYYWSSTTRAGYPVSAWVVYFYDGYVYYYDKHNYYYYVRCVRGGQFDKFENLIISGVSDSVGRVTDNGDGTVTDNLTGLMWEMGGE